MGGVGKSGMFFNKKKDVAAEGAATTIDYLLQDCELTKAEIDELLEDVDYLAAFRADSFSFSVSAEEYRRFQ